MKNKIKPNYTKEQVEAIKSFLNGIIKLRKFTMEILKHPDYSKCQIKIEVIKLVKRAKNKAK